MLKMHLSDIIMILNYVFIFTFLEFTFCVPVLSQREERRIIRSNIAYDILKRRTCDELLVPASNCTELKTKEKSEMHIYVAETESAYQTLHLRAVNSKKITIKRLRSVVVIDPLPDAHYGHGLIIFLIKNDITRRACKRRNGMFYEVTNGIYECMHVPSKKLCQQGFQRHARLSKRRDCSFHFFPKVFVSNEPGINRLKCLSEFNGFGQCPLNKNNIDKECKNMERCHKKTKKIDKPCFSKCDHAIMISGGWDHFINRYRHYLNVKNMWKYLHTKRGYRYDNLKVFFANNSTVDLDGNPKTIETEPATESRKILNHIKYVCTQRSRCVDTLTLYLNGPTFKNGDMLLWDSNKDGQAKDLEILEIQSILDSISTCGARNIVIIADQNYGGHIIEKVEKLRKRNDQFNKVHVMTASSKKTLSYNRHFTQGFIDYDDVYIDDRQAMIDSRPLQLIFQSLQKKLSRRFNIRYLPGKNIDDISITGPSTERAGCTINVRSMFDIR